jgi:hypothetical protein
MSTIIIFTGRKIEVLSLNNLSNAGHQYLKKERKITSAHLLELIKIRTMPQNWTLYI